MYECQHFTCTVLDKVFSYNTDALNERKEALFNVVLANNFFQCSCAFKVTLI